MHMEPITRREARRRWDAGHVIGVTQTPYPHGLDGSGVRRDERRGLTFAELVEISADTRQPAALSFYRPTDLPSTEPGTLDLTERLPESTRDEVHAARVVCDAAGHQPRTYNPHWFGGAGGTFCACGFVQYPGHWAALPMGHPEPPRGKPSAEDVARSLRTA